MKKPAIKKLTLQLDALQVESFEVAPSGGEQRGTVKAYATEWRCPTDDYNTMAHSCIIDTCGYSCDTCDYSCEGTCGDTTCFGESCVCWTDPPHC
jgi:hypothetical protein